MTPTTRLLMNVFDCDIVCICCFLHSAPVLWGWAGSLSFLIRNFFHLFSWTLFFITIQSYVPELEDRVLEGEDGACRNCPPAHIHVPDWVPDQQYLVMEHGLVVKLMLVESSQPWACVCLGQLWPLAWPQSCSGIFDTMKAWNHWELASYQPQR